MTSDNGAYAVVAATMVFLARRRERIAAEQWHLERGGSARVYQAKQDREDAAARDLEALVEPYAALLREGVSGVAA